METQIVLAWLGVLGAFLTIFGMWYKMDRDTSKKIDDTSKDFATKLALAVDNGDQKRARIYERLDSVKSAHKEDNDKLRSDIFTLIDAFRKEVQEAFVPMRICSLMHSASEKTMTELKQAVQEVNQKVDKLVAKMYERDGKD